jgi:hypothetical protein
MLVSCYTCGTEYLTEADPHAFVLVKGKWEHNCGCYFSKKEERKTEQETRLGNYDGLYEEEDDYSWQDIMIERFGSDWVSKPYNIGEAGGLAESLFEAQERIKKLENKIKITTEALDFIKWGCLTFPDGGSPDMMDAMNTAREALDKIKG